MVPPPGDCGASLGRGAGFTAGPDLASGLDSLRAPGRPPGPGLAQEPAASRQASLHAGYRRCLCRSCIHRRRHIRHHWQCYRQIRDLPVNGPWMHCRVSLLSRVLSCSTPSTVTTFHNLDLSPVWDDWTLTPLLLEPRVLSTMSCGSPGLVLPRVSDTYSTLRLAGLVSLPYMVKVSFLPEV